MTSLTLVRRIKAQPSTVFDAMTQPEGIVHWFGPDAGPVTLAETDLRVGGKWRIRFVMLNGEQSECFGEYLDIVPNEKAVFSFCWISTQQYVSQITFTLRPIPEGTELTFTHDRLRNDEVRDRHEQGWSATLDKLQRYFETLATGE